MNPYDGYRLYQIQRTRTRAEIIADDARRGRQAAAVYRGRRALARKTSSLGVMALNAIGAMTARVTTRGDAQQGHAPAAVRRGDPARLPLRSGGER
jgi:hypothetical protein